MSANTTVWLIRYTDADGESKQVVRLHNEVTKYRYFHDPNATVTPIDCAAAEELVEAANAERVRQVGHSSPNCAQMARALPSWVDCETCVQWARFRTALAAFRRTP